MKLLSVHVGKKTIIKHQNRDVETGIFKDLVTGPIKVNTLYLEGDEQADLSVHGGINKAVYAYPFEHYEFWKNKRPDLSFGAGIFGENLSIIGLNELEVYIGDIYQIGTAVFQVTSPRLPCFKLGIKMGDNSFIREFMQAKLTGFYFKVNQEGIIEAGDEIIQISKDTHQLSVTEITRLYGEEKDNIELLEKAISAPNLSKDWVDFFQKRLDGLKK